MKPHHDLTIFLTLLALLFGFTMIIYMVYQMSLLGEVMAADFKIDIIKEPYGYNRLDNYTNGNFEHGNVNRITSDSDNLAVERPLVKRELATVTAYSELDSCSNFKCIMANGESASEGSIACPRKLKLGSKVEILGVVYTCSDRTALKFDGRYDIWMGRGKEGHDRSIKWGKRKLEVKIIK